MTRCERNGYNDIYKYIKMKTKHFGHQQKKKNIVANWDHL